MALKELEKANLKLEEFEKSKKLKSIQKKLKSEPYPCINFRESEPSL